MSEGKILSLIGAFFFCLILLSIVSGIDLLGRDYEIRIDGDHHFCNIAIEEDDQLLLKECGFYKYDFSIKNPANYQIIKR